MVINGDVERFDARAWIAVGTVAGGADAGLVKAAKFSNIKMKEFAWGSAFVTDDRRLGRFQGAQAIEAMALEDAGKGSFRDGKDHEDLGVGTALAAECQDLGFELRRSFARLLAWDGGVIFQARWKLAALARVSHLRTVLSETEKAVAVRRSEIPEVRWNCTKWRA